MSRGSGDTDGGLLKFGSALQSVKDAISEPLHARDGGCSLVSESDIDLQSTDADSRDGDGPGSGSESSQTTDEGQFGDYACEAETTDVKTNAEVNQYFKGLQST